jgi:PAS domain S-box-containing protein
MLRPMTVALPGGEGLELVVLTALSAEDESGLEGNPAERLRQVEAIAQLGSWSWDLEADVMTWSDESYRLFGLTPGAVPVGYEDIRRRMHPENRAQSEEIIERCRRTGEGFAYTRRVVLPDGSVRWHHGRAQAVIAHGRVVRMFGTVQDVTDRVQAEQALRESVQRARELAEENEALRSEIKAQLEEQASRARIVRATDYARCRLERDLHDGAQQRLTTVGLILRSARGQLDADVEPALASALDEAIAELKEGLSELRDLARGLHPAILRGPGRRSRGRRRVAFGRARRTAARSAQRTRARRARADRPRQNQPRDRRTTGTHSENRRLAHPQHLPQARPARHKQRPPPRARRPHPPTRHPTHRLLHRQRQIAGDTGRKPRVRTREPQQPLTPACNWSFADR